MTKSGVRAAFYHSLPMLAGYVVLSIGFGILLGGIGYGTGWAVLMSMSIYAGSMQYVGVSLIAGGASLAVTALTTLTVNIRNLIYSLSMYGLYQDAGWKKPLLVFTITDESYSLLCDGKTPEGEDPHTYRLLVSLFGYAYWAIGSLLGGLIGKAIPFDTTGIEFSMTALFVTVFVEQWTSTKEHRPALLGVGITVLSLLMIGEELFLIPSVLGITLALVLMRPALDRKEASGHDQ